jgi:hypothetical protein
MIVQLENIIERVNILPMNQQNDLAYFWQQDLDSEIKFDSKISMTADKLMDIANNALNEFVTGKTINKGFDQL